MCWLSDVLASLPVPEAAQGSTSAAPEERLSLESWAASRMPMAQPPVELGSDISLLESEPSRDTPAISAEAVELERVRSNLSFLLLSLRDSNAPQEESLGRERERLTAKLRRVASALGFTQFGMHEAISGSGVSTQEGQESVSDVAAVDDLRDTGAKTEPGKTRISGLAGEEGPVTPYVLGLIATSNPYRK